MADRPPPPPPPSAPSQQQQWAGQQASYYGGYYGHQQGYDPYQQYGQQAYYGQQYSAAQAPPPASSDSTPPLPPSEGPAGQTAGYSQQQQQQQQAGQYAQAQQQAHGAYGAAAGYPGYYGQQQAGYGPEAASYAGYGQQAAGYYQGAYPASYYGQQQPAQQQQSAAQAYDRYASAQPPVPDAAQRQQHAVQPAADFGQPAGGAAAPAWKEAANRVAASASSQHRVAAGTTPGAGNNGYDGSYNAVPPPSVMAAAAAAAPVGAGRRTFSIRPQMAKQRADNPAANPLVAAFNQAATKLGGSGGAAAAPAYTAVQVPSRQQYAAAAAPAAPAAVGPEQWPPALKAYVERAFKSCDVRQRPKLQEVLKKVIGDAQATGELWTRDWETMPLPDLTQSAADAAAVLAEVAAVSGPAAASTAGATAAAARLRPGGKSRWSPAQPQHAQQQYAQQQYAQQQYAQQQQQYAQQQRQQQYAQQQQQQQKYASKRDAQRQRVDIEDDRHGYGRRGRKRSYRDDRSDSSQSDSDGDQWSYAERQRRQRRAGRFQDSRSSRQHGGSSSWRDDERRQRLQAMLEDEEEEVDWDELAIKGTCQDLEKSYFRLTSAPDPATVRPEAVLRRALERLIGLLRAKEVNYFYALDQFKGMRQDCTVQHIRNDLAVQVYEAHARAALEYGDVAEYNQCQSQLRTMYNEGVPGSRIEFLAYRIIYQAVHAGHGEILQLLNTLKKVKPKEAAQPEVAHALAVRAALAALDYARYFRLYATAPALGRALMDIYVPKLRFDALNVAVKAFKPSVPVPFLAALLGFVAAAPRPMPTSPAPSGEQAGKSERNNGQVQGDSPSSQPGAAANASISGGAPAAGAAAVHQADPSSGGGAAEAGDGGGEGVPLPGCKELYLPGEHAAKTDVGQGCRDCLAWLEECGAVVTSGDDGGGCAGAAEEASLDCKASAGQLKMPEEKTKVAHGDENLKLEDFLAHF